MVIKSAVEDMTPIAFVAWRFLLGAGLLAVFAIPRGRKMWIHGSVAGLALFAGYSLQTAGLTYTTASNSALITGLYVVINAVSRFGFCPAGPESVECRRRCDLLRRPDPADRHNHLRVRDWRPAHNGMRSRIRTSHRGAGSIRPAPSRRALHHCPTGSGCGPRFSSVVDHRGRGRPSELGLGSARPDRIRGERGVPFSFRYGRKQSSVRPLPHWSWRPSRPLVWRWRGWSLASASISSA